MKIQSCDAVHPNCLCKNIFKLNFNISIMKDYISFI